jgi:hypothetical protein
MYEVGGLSVATLGGGGCRVRVGNGGSFGSNSTQLEHLGVSILPAGFRFLGYSGLGCFLEVWVLVFS